MQALNAQLDFESLPSEHQAAFVGKSAQKICFLPGVEFYKFTDRELFGPGGVASPWWFGVKPLVPGDTGLEETLRRAGKLGASPQQFMQARGAVTKEWNSLSGLLVIRLLRPAWGFAGGCASQRMHLLEAKPEFQNVVWIGGAWQVYLPNLTRSEIVLRP